MRILIVEDDTFKFTQLDREVRTYKGVQSVASASSLQESMSTLSGAHFDVVLLDMALPSHAGEAGAADIYSQPVGGLDVLLYLSLHQRDEQIIILTQYPTVEYNRVHVPLNMLPDALANDDVNNVKGVILFSDDGAWKCKLHRALEMIA